MSSLAVYKTLPEVTKIVEGMYDIHLPVFSVHDKDGIQLGYVPNVGGSFDVCHILELYPNVIEWAFSTRATTPYEEQEIDNLIEKYNKQYPHIRFYKSDEPYWCFEF